ncbi:MAG: glycoside hydrolase family 9 protein [Chloroflexota bacterium]
MSTPTTWQCTPDETLEAPAVSILFFHNAYEEGKQGGLEIIQCDQRIAANGNLRLGPAPDQWALLPDNAPRQIDEGVLSVASAYPDLSYTLRLAVDGENLRLRVDLARPLDPEQASQIGFNLELAPNIYLGKSYWMDGAHPGIFPRQFDGPVLEEHGAPEALGSGRRLVVAPNEATARLSIESLHGELLLLDGRAQAQNGWFIVRGLLPAGVTQNALEWIITPTPSPGWVRPPVIAYSQVGYHPRQKKQAAIELGRNAGQPGKASLIRITPDGETRIRSEPLKRWGTYLSFDYALFDFSDVTAEGLYALEYEGQRTAAFPIRADVYQKGVWQPTLETFFPVQMCHVEVRDLYRVWHGTCHLDDAVQAPVNHKHFDGYRQYEETETTYAPGEHIPGLDRGGWHDAGDYDLAAGSQARTTLILAHIRETFGLASDQTTFDRPNRRVTLHQPDGVPDIVQQVMHGADNLLASYRVIGHSIAGIIEGDIRQYVHLGDAATMTDNVPSADDRWAFTNRDTALEYLVCGTLAASGRVLRGFDDALAGECLATAQKIWQREQGQEPKAARGAYVPGWPEMQAVLAAAELLATTGEGHYRRHILEQRQKIVEAMPFLGAVIAPILRQLDDADFTAAFRQAAEAHIAKLAEAAQQTPFDIPYTAETWRENHPVWGIGWNLLHQAVNLYPLFVAFPDLAQPALITGVLGYNLGCHPCSNKSLVSGVGADSLTVGYGVNRAEWSYTPGGVVSGPSLIRPDFLELQDPFPWLWQQKEYVISGAANYIYCVLAADRCLNA